jgi:hypothetical protein
MNQDRKNQVTDPLLSPCGMYCGFCGVYRAHQTGDQGLKEKMAPFYGCRPEQLKCGGCLSGDLFFYCQECAIRGCALGNELEGCHQCGDFPCAKVTDFPFEPARKMILEAIPAWKEMGTQAWLAKEHERHSCIGCGELLIRGATRCPSCKQQVPPMADG